MLILTVFILAFGVPTYSLLFGVQKFSWHLPRAILNLAYWQIFGELEVLDEIESEFILEICIHTSSFRLCLGNYEISGYIMFILLIAYMTVASVLLINLLIAMFRYEFFSDFKLKYSNPSFLVKSSKLLMCFFIFNLLSNTFDRLQLDTDCIWKFQHYYLVCHHLTLPSLLRYYPITMVY